MHAKLASASRSEGSRDQLPSSERETDYHDLTNTAAAQHASAHQQLDDDDSVFQSYDSPHKPRKKPLWRRKRVLIGCAIVTVIFLAIFIPLLLIIIIPKVAQSMMNSASMMVVQLNMTNPGETEMTVSVLASVGGIPEIFSASLEFTDEVAILWEDKLIGSMQLGTVHVSKGKGDIAQTTTFQIKNTTAFGDFAKVMLSADGFTWTMTSTATVKALGQTIKNLKINKQLDMHGLNNFANVQIQRFNLPSDAPDGNGAIVTIQSMIPNPSPIGMTLGTITLDMYFKTAYLGRVVAKNVTLVGGQPMALDLQGQLLRQTDPVHVQELSLLMSNYLANIPTLATAKGVSVLPDGVNAVSWLTNAIIATTLTVPLQAVQPLNVIKNITINDLNLVMSKANPWSPTANSNSVSADFKIPFNITINITQLYNTTFKMEYQGRDFVELITAVWNTTASDMANNKVVFSIPPSPMNIYNQQAFTDFMTSITQQTSSSVDVVGSAMGVAETSLGTVTLSVPLKSKLPLQGINFANSKPTVSNILVANGTMQSVVITADVGLQNPSIFGVNMGRIVLQVASDVNGTHGYVGTATIPQLILRPGLNTVQAVINVMPNETTFANAFISAFVAGEDMQSSIYGDENTSHIASMIPTLKTLTMSTVIPGIKPAPQLITAGTATPSLGTLLGPRQIPLTVTATNPLATTFWIDTITASVWWQGNFFGGIDSAHIPFAVNTNSTIVSPQVILQCPTGYQFALFLVTQFIPKNLGVLTGAIVNVNMTSSILVAIGGAPGTGYPALITYNQNNIPAHLKIDYSFTGLIKRFLKDDRDHIQLTAASAPDTMGNGSSSMNPNQRREMMWRMSDDQLYASIVALVGEEPPAVHSGMAYAIWMERALRSLYPEHQ